MFNKYCVFSYNFVIFLNSGSSAAALVFYLPGVCTHTDTEGKQRKTRVGNFLKSLEKTQYLMNTLYSLLYLVILTLQNDENQMIFHIKGTFFLKNTPSI